MSETGHSVSVRVRRWQDEEFEENEYEGILKEINKRLYVSFTEKQERGERVTHLLRIDSKGMEWVRNSAGVRSKTAFMAGKSLPFLFFTTEGSLRMELITHDFLYEKKDTHEISVSYSIKQGSAHISKYRTKISISV